MNLMMLDLLLLIVPIVICLVAQVRVSTTYNKYKMIENERKITGFDVARTILDNNGLKDVLVLEGQGVLSDHYDPRKKVIKLSHDIYNGNTIAAASIAAHEVGHALQDKDGYTFMRIRGAIAPIATVASYLGYVAIFIGFLASLLDLVLIGIIALIIILLFELVTLPVEYNASNRAKEHLEKNGILNIDELPSAKHMLGAAALTYVASLLASLMQILRLVLIVIGRRD